MDKYILILDRLFRLIQQKEEIALIGLIHNLEQIANHLTISKMFFEYNQKEYDRFFSLINNEKFSEKMLNKLEMEELSILLSSRYIHDFSFEKSINSLQFLFKENKNIISHISEMYKRLHDLKGFMDTFNKKWDTPLPKDSKSLKKVIIDRIKYKSYVLHYAEVCIDDVIFYIKEIYRSINESHMYYLKKHILGLKYLLDVDTEKDFLNRLNQMKVDKKVEESKKYLKKHPMHVKLCFLLAANCILNKNFNDAEKYIIEFNNKFDLSYIDRILINEYSQTHILDFIKNNADSPQKEVLIDLFNEAFDKINVLNFSK